MCGLNYKDNIQVVITFNKNWYLLFHISSLDDSTHIDLVNGESKWLGEWLIHVSPLQECYTWFNHLLACKDWAMHWFVLKCNMSAEAVMRDTVNSHSLLMLRVRSCLLMSLTLRLRLNCEIRTDPRCAKAFMVQLNHKMRTSHFISFQEAILLILNMKLDRALSLQMSLRNNPIVLSLSSGVKS